MTRFDPHAEQDIYNVECSPEYGEESVAQDVVVTFTMISQLDLFGTTDAEVTYNGVLIYTGGTWTSGWDGTVVASGTVASLTFTITTHPPFVGPIVLGFKGVDLSANTATLYLPFNASVPGCKSLRARTYCGGKRIDLSWENPVGYTRLIIRRNKVGHPTTITDPANTVYTGSGTSYSDTGLDEGVFYYYTVFHQFGDDVYHANNDSKVTGLSIADYTAREGRYLYELLSTGVRKTDGDPSRGADRYRLRDLCDFMQCGMNLYRGWADGLKSIRQPDLTPAGLIGEARNQTGILEAHAWELGAPVDKTYDAGLLRRIAMHMFAANQSRGVCNGILSMIRIFTEWQVVDCLDMAYPICGTPKMLRTHDDSSKLFTAVGNMDPGATLHTPSSVFYGTGAGAGYTSVDVNSLVDWEGNPATLTLRDDGYPNPTFLMTDLGDFVCIKSTTYDGDGPCYIFEHADPTSYLRSEILGTGVATGSTFAISTLNVAGRAWQYQSGPLPTYGVDAFKGLVLMDDTGGNFPILSSTEGQIDTIVLTVTGAPITGNFSIAQGFAGLAWASLRQTKLYIYQGDFSFTYHPMWEKRLALEISEGSYWSPLTGAGATTGVSGIAPADCHLIVVVPNVASVIDTVADVGPDWVDLSLSYATDIYTGHYMCPRWSQTKLFRIIHHDGARFTLEVPPGDETIDSITIIGEECFILSPADALRYQQVTTASATFIDSDSTLLLRFKN